MDIPAYALVIIRPGQTTALVRITAPGMLLWRRYPLPHPATPEALTEIIQRASRHLAPHGGTVRLSYQLPLL